MTLSSGVAAHLTFDWEKLLRIKKERRIPHFSSKMKTISFLSTFLQGFFNCGIKSNFRQDVTTRVKQKLNFVHHVYNLLVVISRGFSPGQLK